MTRQLSLFILTGVSLAVPVMLTAQNSDQALGQVSMQAVEAAFPQELRYSGEAPSENPYSVCAALFSRNEDGSPEFVAAAYSGHGVEVAMLAFQNGSAQITDAVTDRQFGFDLGSCDASIVSLADPSQPSSLLSKTVEISFRGQDWFFIWDGDKLQNITALRPGSGLAKYNLGPESYMHNTDIVDLDHSGAVQIVGNNGDSDKFPQDDGISSTGTDTLFRYNSTTYVPAKTILYLREFEPNAPKSTDDLAAYKTDASPWTQEIDMHHTPAPSYRLTIVNGDRNGSNRVSSVEIEVNGVTIIQPAGVNQGVETLTRTIQLKKQNKIKVTADGPSGSHAYVIVE